MLCCLECGATTAAADDKSKIFAFLLLDKSQNGARSVDL